MLVAFQECARARATASMCIIISVFIVCFLPRFCRYHITYSLSICIWSIPILPFNLLFSVLSRSLALSLYRSLSLLSTLYVIVIKLTSLAVVSAVVVYLPMLAIHIVFFIFFSFIFAHHVHLHASIFASSHYCPTMFYYYVWPCSSHYLMSKLSISIKLLSFTINTLTYTHLNIEQILH